MKPPDDTAPPAPFDRYAVLRVRDFQLYLVSRFIASFGLQMLETAVGWELYQRTNSPLALGFIGLAQITPLVLLTLPAGHVADQYDRRRIIFWMQLVTAASCAGLTYVSWAHAPVLWTYVFLLVAGVARAFVWPATAAILPQLVPRPDFPSAVTWSSGSFQLSAALGPVTGGLVIALTGQAVSVYAFNVVAALVCGAMFVLVRSRPSEPVKRQKMTLANLWVGVRYVFDTPVILSTITLDLFAVLLGGATALLPVYARDILHVGASGLGWLRAGTPIGSVGMALILAHRPPMQKAGWSLLLAVGGFGLATIIFGLSRSFWLSLAMMIVLGLLDNVSVVVRQTLVQLRTPDDMRGRVSAVNNVFIGASNEFGGFESGLVAAWFGSVFAVVSGGIGTILVVAAVAMFWPELRRIGRLDPAAEAQPAAAGGEVSAGQATRPS